MSITGALDNAGADLVLARTVAAPAARIWEHLHCSELLATWFGTFTGDPASGSVMVTMAAEPGEATASEYTIHACEPGRLLTVSSSMGEDTWRLSLELADADGGDGARVALRHHDVPLEMLQYVGPGWEWYLDRLTGAVTGGEVPGMDVWDSRYMTLSEDYAALAG
ncbi:MAG: SRPBCC domain-containing protein [Brachybacterium tyrofermentans]